MEDPSRKALRCRSRRSSSPSARGAFTTSRRSKEARKSEIKSKKILIRKCFRGYGDSPPYHWCFGGNQ
eukprot:scaffold489_cov259-Pinguiococcus_pyrenoidosus.AAC.43